MILKHEISETLDEQYRKKLLIKEKKLEGQLKERQELFSMAFEQDMQLYKESGIMPNLRSNFFLFISTRIYYMLLFILKIC